MRFLDLLFPPRDKSADVAKDRLQILVTQERAERGRPSYLPMLQKEILEVIRKYVEVDQEDVQVSVDRADDYEVLALNVVLPERTPVNIGSA